MSKYSLSLANQERELSS